MTDKPTSGAVVALPSIGDPAVLADILMYSGRDALSVMMTEDGDPNDYAKIVFGVASIFMGHTDSLELPKDWDPVKAGPHYVQCSLKCSTKCPKKTAQPLLTTKVFWLWR